MDEAFFLRARRMLGQAARQPLAHAMLVASVCARQAATPTAQLACVARTAAATSAAGATAVLLGGQDGWRQARAAQAGCFNRAVAARRRNAP